MNYIKRDIRERFWEKVDKSGACWIWTAAKCTSGYGIFEFPNPKKAVVAHKVAWSFEYGEVPAGLFVCHRCDNPPCVNPGHLFLGTPKDNTRDAVSKGRMASGERHGRAKLSRLDVENIRKEYSARNITQKQLGSKYGVSQSNVYRIVGRHNWTQF